MEEALGHALIDSGCCKTVCGKIWLNSYLDSIPRAERLKIELTTAPCKFRFGDGETYDSMKIYNIPVNIGGIPAAIQTHVIDCDIPLLLSRESLKKAHAEIDFASDTIYMFGKKLPIKTSKTGHLLLPLTKFISEDCFLTSPIDINNPDLYKKQITKLHKQFAHPRPEKLKILIRNSGISNKDVDKAVDETSENCDTCKKFKKPPPRPIVAMPLSTEFNETVAMDIKFIMGHPVLHLIDHVTRYSAACRLNNKKPESVIQAILSHWIRIFGHPKYFLFDNGGEFDNKEMKELCEKFNIHIKTTAAESPWSNGLCERGNAILADMVLKISQDSNCPLDLAIPWATSAKNALSNTYGFSPNQLVFGKNVNLPNARSDLPPAQNTDSSPLIAKHLMALHKARQAFITQESCEKLRRALNKQTRNYSEFQYHNGDNVYYKRSDQKVWHGPAKVLGQDGPQFLLKHGSRYIRVHQCKMQPTGDFDLPTTKSHNNENEEQPQPPTELTLNESQPLTNDSSDSENETPLNNVTREQIPDVPDININATPPCAMNRRASRIPRALKRLANYNKPPVPRPEEEEVLFGMSSHKSKFKEAKEEEIKRWKENDVFEETNDTGQPRVSTRWVCTEKIKKGITTYKARLVARGFEEDTSQLRKDSPTCSKESLRLLLVMIAGKDWTLNSMDVKGAYLQGLPITRELYLQPPTGYSDGKIWKLKKTPYGLVDAGRKWYMKILTEFKNLGASPSAHDKAMFLWKNGDHITGILVAHVDDFLYGGDQSFLSKIVPQIKTVFQIGSEEENSFKYTGLEVASDRNSITLATLEYSQSITEIETIGLRCDKERPLTQKEITTLRSKAGQINWISGQSRPDLAFDNCFLANKLSKPTVMDFYIANKIIRKIGTQNIKIHFPRSLDMEQSQLVAFCDASHANLRDRGSQGAFLIFLIDQKGVYCLLSWHSKKIKRIVNSSLAAECLAAVDTAEHCLLMKIAIEELTRKPIKISIFSDNHSLIDASHTTSQLENKRLQIDVGILREMLDRKEIEELRWIDTKHQIANALTKAGAPTDYLLKVINDPDMRFNFSTGIFE